MEIKESVEVLHKSITRKFETQKIHSSFMHTIWGADLADMQLLSKFYKRICFFIVLLILILNMHGLFLGKMKRVLQLLMLFFSNLDKSSHKTKLNVSR